MKNMEKARSIRDNYLRLGNVTLKAGAAKLGISVKMLTKALDATGQRQRGNFTPHSESGTAQTIGRPEGALPTGSDITWGAISTVPWVAAQGLLHRARP